MNHLDADYWDQRYQRGKTGWDLGHISRAMQHIIDQLHDTEVTILIPGAGNAFEVEYLWKKGFQNIYLLDWAMLPLQSFARRNPYFPKNQLLLKDFFELDGTFDIILEQTFFCSLQPRKRSHYVEKTWDLLKPEGRIKGVLFTVPLYTDRPPFGGSKSEYEKLFSSHFEILKMEDCLFSESDRMEMELEIELKKK